MLLSIVIPCLNEEKTICAAVRQAYSAAKQINRSFEIIVADSGSTDNSLVKVRKQNIARIIPVPIKGYGAALHWGILQARGEYVFYADADLSYNFFELPKFINLIKEKKLDLVLGSRFKGTIEKGSMPFLHQYFGTPLLTGLIRIIYQLPTTDCNSGMRMIKRSFYLQLGMNNAGMEWASELLIKSALAGGKYGEVPITLYPDQRQRKPHLIPWSDGWRHLKAIILLKPDLLFGLTGSFIILALLLVKSNLGLSLFCLLAAITLFFCTLAAKLLNYVIDDKTNLTISLINTIPLVPLVVIAFIFGFMQFFIFSERYLFVQMLLLNIIFVACIWVFFIETIKTHLMNKLSRIDNK